MSITNEERAKVLTEAIPHIQNYYGKIVVIKYGGNAMINDELKQQVMGDIVLLTLIGVQVVLVHGGGTEITDLLTQVGKATEFVDGLRVTDKETIKYVQMALAGKVNLELVNLLQVRGLNAIGVSGIDSGLIKAKQIDPKLGYVGEITQVDPQVIFNLLEEDYVPIVSSLAGDNKGNIYNINADVAASYIAAAIEADNLIFLTDTVGILRDKSDPSSLIQEISAQAAKELFDQKIVTDGMIPKLQGALDAINMGVPQAIMLDGRKPHSLLLELLTDEGSGTMITQ